MRTAYSYRRFSSGQQAEQKGGDSIRRQKRGAEDVANEKGWKLSRDTFTDEAQSAFHGKNLDLDTALTRFLTMLKNGSLAESPILIVEDLDRLSREKIFKAISLFSDIIQAGCDVYTIINDRLYSQSSLDNPMELMEVMFRFYLAHDESHKKSEREKRRWVKLHEGAKQAKPMFVNDGRHRSMPFWLEIKNGKFIPIPEKLEIIEQIFSLSADGMGTFAIAKKLNVLYPKLAPLTHWTQKTVYDILNDGRVIGTLTSKTETIPNYYPRVISEDAYNAAAADLNTRKMKRGRTGKYTNLFASMIYHKKHKCNMTLIHKTSKRPNKVDNYKYLVSRLSFVGKKPYASEQYEQVETVLLQYLYELDVSTLLNKNDLKIKIKSLEGQIAKIINQQKAIGEELKTYDVPPKVAVQALFDLERKEAELITQLNELKREQAAPQLENVKQLIALLRDNDSPETRMKLRQAIRHVIKQIDYERCEDTYRLTIVPHNSTPRTIEVDRKKGKVTCVTANDGSDVVKMLELSETECIICNGKKLTKSEFIQDITEVGEAFKRKLSGN